MPPERIDDAEAGMKLRSLLFVPADSERKFTKADGIGSDALIPISRTRWRQAARRSRATP